MLTTESNSDVLALTHCIITRVWVVSELKLLVTGDYRLPKCNYKFPRWFLYGYFNLNQTIVTLFMVLAPWLTISAIVPKFHLVEFLKMATQCRNIFLISYIVSSFYRSSNSWYCGRCCWCYWYRCSAIHIGRYRIWSSRSCGRVHCRRDTGVLTIYIDTSCK